MEELGTQVASPIFLHNTPGASRFCDARAMAKKRSLPFQGANFSQHLYQQQQQQYLQQRLIPDLENSRNSWNPSNWEWDNTRLVAKPLDTMEIPTEQQQQQQQQQRSTAFVPAGSDVSKNGPVGETEEDESLFLKLGGSVISSEQPATRPSKRVRSGSPGTAGGCSYPMCQVDNCKADLSAAKDYHRRHKVCEVHSKAGKALVGKHMQRFCQQCSRFHPLSEFDDGKRSCRRRLAGHNRRRRKTQLEDASSQMLLSGNGDKDGKANMDIVNLLTVLARAQGNNTEESTRSSSPSPNKDQLIQIINRINSIPIPADIASILPVKGISSRIDQEKLSSEILSKSKGNAGPSTMNLLAVLSDTLATPAPEDSDCQTLNVAPNLPLRLFSSSPEDDSPPKLASSRKYFSSDSSNLMEDRSPSSSPPVARSLFPTKASRQTVKPDSTSTSGELTANVNGSRVRGGGGAMSLELFGGPNAVAKNVSVQNSPYRGAYASSSGSDQSPSSLNSDHQDCTGRILFKLFDKDPSHLPASLRAQIYNWLSHSPSEMEGYIRPGCIALSIYISMPSSSWDQLEGNFLQHINSLLQDSSTDFWGNGRFLVHTEKHLASHKHGKVQMCKSWRAWNSPQLITVSPLAVVAGKETSLLLKGRNLKTFGTKIYCTHAGGWTLNDTSDSICRESAYEEIRMCSFTVCAPSERGRCFIEIDNGVRGTSFPVIIADATLCQELRLLEAEFDETKRRSGNRAEALHFLNELGWLFQRKVDSPRYSLTRFRFLFVFSVERGFCALVRTLLGIVLEKGPSVTDDEAAVREMLSETNLLSRAVKRRCKNMVDLLVNYSSYVFPPNHVGPGGITPLHLAACLSDADDIIDALTNDPQEIGLLCWNSCLDANGLSPFAYASMRNRDSYNTLVARKLADRIAGQVSVSISNEIERQTSTRDDGNRQELSFRITEGPKSCSRCAAVGTKYPRRRVPGSQGLLHQPYLHSMLAIAAVCVCVCLFLRGAPNIGVVTPFKWENLNFGSM